MKNALLFLSISLFWTATMVNAQGIEPRFGFRVGVNYSSIVSDAIVGDLEENRFGAMAGFFAEYPLSDLISIQPELQYSTQGNLDKELRLNYIQLPVLLKLNITDVFNVHLGPQFGLKAWEWERNDVYSTFELSALAGLGVNITNNFFADLRFSYGFTNVFEDPKNALIKDVEGKNMYAQFTIGYRL